MSRLPKKKVRNEKREEKGELERYVSDLIRDGKLVYSAKRNDDGTVLLRRMRLSCEDRPGSCEYVDCTLVELEVETDG